MPRWGTCVRGPCAHPECNVQSKSSALDWYQPGHNPFSKSQSLNRNKSWYQKYCTPNCGIIWYHWNPQVWMDLQFICHRFDFKPVFNERFREAKETVVQCRWASETLYFVSNRLIRVNFHRKTIKKLSFRALALLYQSDFLVLNCAPQSLFLSSAYPWANARFSWFITQLLSKGTLALLSSREVKQGTSAI